MVQNMKKTVSKSSGVGGSKLKEGNNNTKSMSGPSRVPGNPESLGVGLTIKNPDTSKSFNIIRPLCVQVMESPTVQHLDSLASCLATLSSTIEPCLLDYLLFPLVHHLKADSKYSEEVRGALFGCVRVVVNKWEMHTYQVFLEIFQSSMMGMCKIEDPGNFEKSQLETLTLNILDTAHGLLSKSLTKYHSKLFQDKYIPVLGHGICLLLQIIAIDTTKQLRLKALKVTSLIINSCQGNPEACHKLFKFLPGLATTFIKNCTAVKGARYSAEVLCNCLSALASALTICISHEPTEVTKHVDNNILVGIVNMSEDFLFHSEPKLRKSLAQFSIDIIEKSNGKLPDCCEMLWNNVFTLSSDPEESISKMCMEILQKPQYVQTIQELMNFKSIDKLLKKCVIQGNVGEVKNCLQSAQKVCSSLIVSKLNLEQIATLLPRIGDLRGIVLRHLSSDQSEATISPEDLLLEKICTRMLEFIFVSNSYNCVIMELGTVIRKLSSNPTEVTSLRCAGVIKATSDLLYYIVSSKEYNLEPNVVTNLLEAYLQSLQPLESSPTDEAQSAKLNNIAMIHNSCILEGFPPFVILDPKSESYLLVPLIEYAGIQDCNYNYAEILNSQAIQAIQCIAKVYDETVPNYIGKSLDFIMAEFGSRIDSPSHYPLTPYGLIYLSQHFDFTQHAQFIGFIDQVLIHSTDQNLDVKFHENFVHVFIAFVNSMWTHFCQGNSKKEAPKDLPVSSKSKLIERVLIYHKSLDPGLCEEFNNLDVGDEHDQEEEETGPNHLHPSPASEESYPPHILLTSKISERAGGYLASPHRSVQLQACDVLIRAFEILEPYENVLLPLVHTCWPGVEARFRETDSVVLRKGFDLLFAMCKFARSFLRSRTTEEIFPIMHKYLLNLASNSKTMEEKNTVYYTFTQSYKLQLTMLSGIAELCKALEISERTLDKIVSSALTYMAPDQHKNLREAALQLIINLAKGPLGSCVWMKLIGAEIIQPPTIPKHPAFKPIPLEITNPPQQPKSSKKKISNLLSSSNKSSRRVPDLFLSLAQ